MIYSRHYNEEAVLYTLAVERARGFSIWLAAHFVYRMKFVSRDILSGEMPFVISMMPAFIRMADAGARGRHCISAFIPMKLTSSIIEAEPPALLS